MGRIGEARDGPFFVLVGLEDREELGDREHVCHLSVGTEADLSMGTEELQPPPDLPRPRDVPPRPEDLTEAVRVGIRSEEHTSELQSRENLVCRLLLEK